MRIMNYIQSEIIYDIPNNYISKESDYYAIWEKQRGNQFWSNFALQQRLIELNKQYCSNDLCGIYPLIKI